VTQRGTPLVSVLLPTRDGARYLGEALASLAAQTWPALEIVAVDDGSRDETRSILDAFAGAHANVRVLEGRGNGTAAALDLAARAARGELLARHDDDDLSAPERIERQARFLVEHPGVGVVGTAATIVGELGETLTAYPVPLGEAAMRRTLRRGPPFVHGSVMMRVDVYRAAGGYRAAFGAAQDFDLWLRLPEGTGIANLEEPLYRWRRHAGGVFSRAREDQLRFTALARAFALERRESGADSITAFERAGGFDGFLAGYAHADRLRLLLGETYAREGRVREARAWLAGAFGRVRSAGPALAWWALTWAVALTPRAARARAGASRSTHDPEPGAAHRTGATR
jgi:glycosyltransferase involved in cell wall biosynthesis